MEKVIKTTPDTIEHMAKTTHNAIQLRMFAISLVDQVNAAHELMEVMDGILASHYNDRSVIRIPYIYNMRLPDPIHLDEFFIIGHPSHLVQWKLDFYAKFGNCIMWQPKFPLFTDDNRWIVDPDEFEGDINEEYWAKYGKYMAQKNDTITNFNKSK